MKPDRLGGMAPDSRVSPKIIYETRTDKLVVTTGSTRVEINHDGAASWVARLEDVGGAKAADLKGALTRSLHPPSNGTSPDDFEVVEGEEPDFDVDYTSSDVQFRLANYDLVLELVVTIDDWIDDETQLVERLRRIAQPFLKRGRAVISSATMLDGSSRGPWACSLTVVPSLRQRTIEGLYRLGADIIELLTAASEGAVNLWSAVHLVRAGRGDLLIGLEENQWLDVKSRDYDLASDAGKISLAQDVSRFANSEDGGAIVIGMATKKTPMGETIRAICPVPYPKTGARRHRQAIDSRLFPLPDGLSIDVVQITGGAMIVVYIPPQPEEHKPFLVHGAIVDGVVQGAFISILRRRGEESIPITAPTIHATLAAGRALLRRGELPREADG